MGYQHKQVVTLNWFNDGKEDLHPCQYTMTEKGKANRLSCF